MIAAFHTLGCKTNAYETQAIREQFIQAGFETGEFSEPCDVYVINTCAVTQEAARKSRQMTGRCKKKNPDALVVVTGCYAQDAAEKILADSLADMVVGNSEKSQILSMVQKRLEDSAADRMNVKDLTRCTEYEDQNITGQNSHVRAYVKIQDGCDRFCSYCLIPYMRGRSRSRNTEDILAEAEALAAGGYHELILTGIDISSFCAGGEADEDTAELIEQLSSVEGIERIRLGSLEVSLATERFIDRMSRVKEFCPQFHLSLQSGCDTVLKRMNRHYTSEEYLAAVNTIRKAFPDAAITTDIIAGFPGETQEEFEITESFMHTVKFSRVHAFPYSRREKTRADRMPGQLVKAVKEERARKLIEEAEILREEYESGYIGRKCQILGEEIIAKTDADGTQKKYLAGYTPEYVYILADTGKIEEPEKLINQFVEVVPDRFREGNLWADSIPQ